LLIYKNNKTHIFTRAYEVWGSAEGLAREIWKRKKALEEDEKFRKGMLMELKVKSNRRAMIDYTVLFISQDWLH